MSQFPYARPNVFEIVEVFKREQAITEVTVSQLSSGACTYHSLYAFFFIMGSCTNLTIVNCRRLHVLINFNPLIPKFISWKQSFPNTLPTSHFSVWGHGRDCMKALAMRPEGRETHRSSGASTRQGTYSCRLCVFRSVLLTSLQLAWPPQGLQTCKER